MAKDRNLAAWVEGGRAYVAVRRGLKTAMTGPDGQPVEASQEDIVGIDVPEGASDAQVVALLRVAVAAARNAAPRRRELDISEAEG